MTDPTNLLSTLSQSSAAMVAIIGGFLVSKLVAISSEKEALRRQLKSAKQSLKHVKPAYESAHTYRLENSLSTFSDWVTDDLVNAGQGAVDYEELTSNNIPRGSSVEEMLPHAIRLHTIIKNAYKEIAPLLRSHYSDTDVGLNDLKKKGLKIAEAHESLYEEVFDALRSQLPDRPPATIMGMALPTTNLPHISMANAVRPAWDHAVDARRLDESIKEEQDLQEQLATLDSEIHRLTQDIAKLGRPVGVIPAAWILSLLSLLGIVLPIVVMACEPTRLTFTLKSMLIGSFVVGLAAVLGYIVWYLKKINDE